MLKVFAEMASEFSESTEPKVPKYISIIIFGSVLSEN